MSREPLADPLLSWRSHFPILDTCTYLVSHSLGAMPAAVADELKLFADTWAARGVRAWHEGWWEMAQETANLLAPILGV
ncbi:MAG: kynureninase, partial [Acidobacteriota bacterium]|nr:kynureninase [Acidobacteriota bacterium]